MKAKITISMKFIEPFAHFLSERNRQKKFLLFSKLVNPDLENTILDIGVTNKEYSPSDNYLEKKYLYPQNITAVSLENLSEFQARYPKIKTFTANGLNLPFSDNSFDIGYSNAVLEHVGGKEKQIQFLKEIFRVSKKGFITTPNKNFPIEIHTRTPLLHLLLSESVFDKFLNSIGKKWATGNYMNLLSFSELEKLLQNSGIKNAKIIKNRFLFLTLTFTVYWSKH